MFREAFFILIMRGDYDGLPAFHILGLGGKGTLPVDAVFLPIHTQSMGKGWALPGFPHLLSTLSPPFIHFAWAKAGHSRLSPYNYVNKKSHFIHSWIQCFLTKKNILIRGIKMTHLQFNLDIELLKANIMNSVPRKCSECMYRI